MLKFKVKQVLQAAGKKSPAKWLVNVCGFNRGKAYVIAGNNQKSINLEDFSRLCYALQCTPNDLLYWENTPHMTIPDTHPLAQGLVPPATLSNWQEVFKNLAPNEVVEYHKEITAFIEKKRDNQNNTPK